MRKGFGEKDHPFLIALPHLRHWVLQTTALPSPKDGALVPRARASPMLRVPRSLGYVNPLFQCLSCATSNKEAGLAQSHLLGILASLNLDEASRHVLQACVHTDTHFCTKAF